MSRRLLIFFVAVLAAFLLYSIADFFSPGSYANAEVFEMNMEESELIELIEDFKEKNPQFGVPQRTQLLDHRDHHWYVIYFYYPEEDEIIYTRTRPSDKEKTSWALISVTNGRVGGWKEINKDLDATESRVQISRFEDIVNAIRRDFESK